MPVLKVADEIFSVGFDEGVHFNQLPSRLLYCQNKTSHRVIPLNQSARSAFARMWDRAQALGFTEPEHYIWSACQWGRIDPTRPIKKWDSAWRSPREAAGLPGLRFHDLRHTIISELAERGEADQVIMAIAGHLSRPMLDYYSKIRMDAKRKALEGLDIWRQQVATQQAAEARIQ